MAEGWSHNDLMPGEMISPWSNAWGLFSCHRDKNTKWDGLIYVTEQAQNHSKTDNSLTITVTPTHSLFRDCTFRWLAMHTYTSPCNSHNFG